MGFIRPLIHEDKLLTAQTGFPYIIVSEFDRSFAAVHWQEGLWTLLTYIPINNISFFFPSWVVELLLLFLRTQAEHLLLCLTELLIHIS